MKLGDVRVARHGGSLILLVKEHSDTYPRRWEGLNLQTGEIYNMVEKWLVHDTTPWVPT